MNKLMIVSKDLAKIFYYSSAALAFTTPEIRVTNAALGLVAGTYIGKRVAGVAATLLTRTKHKGSEAGYEKPGKLAGLFNKNFGPALAIGLLSGTALATGYVGANAYHDIKYNDRAPVWAVAGSAIDGAYKLVRPVLTSSADFGQAVTQNINPLPQSWQTNTTLQSYGKQLDGLAMCADRVITNEPSFAGTCADTVKSFVNPVFDRK